MLPATGAPVSRHRTSKMKEMFDEYVRTRTRENWKFWIVSFFFSLTSYFKMSGRNKAKLQNMYDILQDYLS